MRICPQCGTRFEEPIQYCPNDGSQTYEAQESAPERVDPLIGRVVDGRYRIEQQIGEGGMGVVYLATHTVLGKKLALKILRGDNSRDADVVQRFMQEAQAATSIGHSNIIDIADFGRLPDGAVYFVMEYLNGTSLSEMIKSGGSVAMPEAIHICRQIASALEAAHARGIVHRDLKPDNIFLIKQGGDPRFVKVLDFGVAKVGGAASKLTKTGMVFGTPHYMSPEQAAGHSVDQRTDIYALGVIMYEMFTGKVPFDADTFMGILSKHMFEAPARPSDIKGQSLGPLENVILRALEKNPDARYQQMGELLADLETVARGGSVAAGTSSGPLVLGGPASSSSIAFGQPPISQAVPVAAATATEAPSGGGGRGIMLVAAAMIALLVVGVGVFAVVVVVMPEDDGEVLVRAQDVDDPEEPSIAQPPPEQQPHPTNIVVAQPPAQPPLQPARQEEEPLVAISSEPAGAEVLLDGVMVGNTPVRVPRPASGMQMVTLRLRGHEQQQVQISQNTGESLSITLERERQAVRAPRQPPPQIIVQRAEQPQVVRQQLPPSQPPPRRNSSTSEVVDPWAN